MRFYEDGSLLCTAPGIDTRMDGSWAWDNGVMLVTAEARNGEQSLDAKLSFQILEEHEYGTEGRETVLVRFLDADLPEFEPLVGRDVPFTNMLCPKPDKGEGSIEDAIVPLEHADAPDAFLPVYTLALHNSIPVPKGDSPDVDEYGIVPLDEYLVEATNLPGLTLDIREINSSGVAIDHVSRVLWQGEWFAVDDKIEFMPVYFHISEGAEGTVFFTSYAPSGGVVDTNIILTADGAFVHDSDEAEVSYELFLWTDEEGTIRYRRTCLDFLNIQEELAYLRFLGRENDFYYETGTCSFADGAVFLPKERHTGEEWFQKAVRDAGNAVFRSFAADFTAFHAFLIHLRYEYAWLLPHPEDAEPPYRAENAVFLIEEESLTNDVYRSFHIDFDGATLPFSGSHSQYSAPVITAADLTGDGYDDLAVVLVSARGAYLWLEEAHIFDIAHLRECPVGDPEKYVADTVEFSADEENYVIRIGDSRTAISKAELGIPAERLYETAGVGSHFRYEIQDGTLVCKAACSVSPAMTVGELVVSYEYRDGGFVPAGVEFAK